MKKKIECYEFLRGIFKCTKAMALVVLLSMVAFGTVEASLTNSSQTVLSAQTKSVSGIVTDAEGIALPGVNVVEKGTNNGTITDLNGNYAFSLNSENSSIIFSYVGYISEEVIIGNQSTINMTLMPDITSLDEIVVIGYGTAKKSDLTGSVASADLEAFKESPNVNLMQSLQGSVPGVAIGQTNQAGAEPSIEIRGQSTLNGNSDPLIVLDGIIYRGRIGDINPADIKSVDILKDPSSKAIYGAQSANGVILITSKGGKVAKKPTISYSGSYAFQSPTVDARLLNREESLQKVKDVEYKDAYLAPDYTSPNPAWDFSQSELLPALLEGIDNGTNYDWWGSLTSPGHITDHQVSISGGTEATQYYVSGGYTDQKGIMLNDAYKRVSVRINLQTDVNKWLTIGANTFGSFTNFSGNSPNMGTLARTSPLVTPYGEDGEFVINHLGDNIVNPYLNAQADDKDLNNLISGNFFALVNVPGVEGLTYKLNYNNNYRWYNHFYSNKYDEGQTGRAYKANSTNHDMLLDNIVNYNRDFGRHGLGVTLVAGFNTIAYERGYANGTNITNLNLSYNSLEQAVIQEISSDAWDESSIYQMGRINYNFDNKYFLSSTLRRDGFSGFSNNNKVGYFPSVGLGWLISEESFLDLEAINFLKLRVSYGENGNLTERYSSLARVDAKESSKYVFGDGSSTSPGQSVASLSNNDLSWEKTVGYNFGVDFELLNSRINGNVEIYNSTTNGLLWEQVLPELTGFSKITTNLGEIKNTGFEFALNTIPVKTNDFSWELGFMFYKNKNKIVSLLGEDNDGDGKEDDLVASGLFIDESIGTVYSYELDGLWQVNDEIPDGYFPGTYRIVNQDDDETISAEFDRKILGRAEPAYRFGIQNTVKYKEFSLRFFINSIQGGKDGYLAANHPDGVSGTTGTAQNSNWFNFYDYWAPSRPDAKYSNPWLQPQISPRRYEQRNFVRLQDISLAYNLKSEKVKKLGMQSAKVYISGKNLFTFTNWDGWDPETAQGIGNSTSIPGEDDPIYAFPLLKSYNIGIDFSF